MNLVTDPNEKIRQEFPGSQIWERKTSFGLDIFSLSYHSIQILDGNGQPIEPAYSTWQKTSPTNYITGLRPDSLDLRQQC